MAEGMQLMEAALPFILQATSRNLVLNVKFSSFPDTITAIDQCIIHVSTIVRILGFLGCS